MEALAYRPDGREVTTTPLAADDWKGVEPIYETMPGWSDDLRREDSAVCRRRR
ncbi:hypothetical protein ACLBOM_32695 [Escherichia coli]